MATVTAPPTSDWTVADLLEQLGDIPPNRIRLVPSPGKATEEDLLDQLDHHDRACELIDGILVEKTMGAIESILAMAIGGYLREFLKGRKLGIVLGPDGPLRILVDQVRMPDVSYVNRKKFPGGKLPKVPIFKVAPDLAVEILSASNSPREMERKLRDYFAAGVELVWYIDPETRTARVYTSPDQCEMLDESQTLTGGNVLPGFELSLKDLFSEAELEQDQE
jgi:Uma2 family endonuclease